MDVVHVVSTVDAADEVDAGDVVDVASADADYICLSR